jgi:hypothetical protein
MRCHYKYLFGMDDIQRYDFWRREMDEYLANIKKEEEAKKKAEEKKKQQDDEEGTFEYNDGI